MSTKSEHRGCDVNALNGEIKVEISEAPVMNGSNELVQNGMFVGSHVGCQSEEPLGSAAGDFGNGVPDDELSPSSLRRSTRASALKAAERIKLKETLTPVIDGLASHSGEGYASEEDEEPVEFQFPPKKRRLAAGRVLDQFDCKFGIKVDGSEVLLMSDESELSSLNEVELDHVKKAYEKVLHRERTDEQKRERELLIKTLEAELRLEEAKLTMLKKLRLSQQVSVKQLQDANVRKLTANVSQNGSGNAYKPPVATPQGRAGGVQASAKKDGVNAEDLRRRRDARGALRDVNERTAVKIAGASNVQSGASRAAANAASALLGLTPQQQQMLQNAAKSGLLNPAAAQALIQQAQQAHQSNGRIGSSQSQQSSGATSSSAPPHGCAQSQSRPATASSSVPRESPAQKAAAAKLALRRQLEQHLLQIPPPRPPPPDMQFIPNGNQPDFCCLLGLDLAVQRILKDKNATRRVSEEPYVCEECETDYTPLWRAIGADENSLHLYCETCVKAAQKKKMRQDHTTLLRKTFNKVLEKEQELERQIAEGKYDNVATSSCTPQSGTPAATPPPGNHSKTAGSPATAAQSTPLKTSSSSSALLQQQSKSSGQKRGGGSSSAGISTSSGPSASTSSSSSSTANAAAAAIAAAASGAGSATLLQQQIAAAAALRHTNPVLAAMMANPLLNAPNMLQMQWNPLVQQRLPNLAMAALAQAVQSAQQGSGSGSASSNPLAALAASMNPAATMLSNPQMVRQLQQMHQVMQRNFLLEYAKSQSKK